MLSVNDQASWWPHMRWKPFFYIIILERERKRKEQACTAWHDSWCNDRNLRWRWWHFGIIWPYMLLFLRGFKCLIIHLWLLRLFFHWPCAAHMFFFFFFLFYWLFSFLFLHQNLSVSSTPWRKESHPSKFNPTLSKTKVHRYKQVKHFLNRFIARGGGCGLNMS